MLRERIIEFFKDLGFVIKRFFTSRIVPFVAVGVVLFGILIYRLFVLQIVKGESYTTDYTLKAEKTITTNGTRGNIYDCNGKLLAYSELAYSVTIEDSGTYSTNAEKAETLNGIIAKMVTIIENNGDTVDYDFGIDCDSDGEFCYTMEGNTLLRFLRDIYGKTAISELSDEEKNSTAADTAEYLAERYGISDEYDNYIATRIMYIRYNLAGNSYKRYMTFTVANNVNSNTMASILENSDVLTGVNIAEGTIRKYNYSTYIAHIIGYTGKVSSDQLEELKMVDSSYDANDVVGKSGIEEAYETTLAGTKGEQTILVDNVGRVLEVTEETPATAGQDVYLTIDVELQEKIYNLMERRLAEIIVSYLTEDDEAIQDDGQIFIPMKDVYFALIDNNVIDMDEIANMTSEAATTAYSLFTSQKSQVVSNLESELASGTAYNNLSDNMKKYIKLIRTLLIDNGILDSDKISSSAEIQEAWSDGTISLREYLKGAIENQWVNIYNLDLDSAYPSADEVLEAVVDVALELVEKDSDFDKLMYSYLIDNHLLGGREVCLILMEQGAVEYTESEYLNIYNGGSTLVFMRQKIGQFKITPAQLALDPCSGSCVVENPNTGEILAMVSYPSYDINYFSGSIDSSYYAKLLDDKSTPLVNRVTQTRIAPGSTFKPLIAIAGLNEGVISSTEEVYCDGIFDTITPNIKCWVYPKKHEGVNTEEALEHSCNEYFCEIGYRLSTTSTGEVNFEYGLSRIKKYTELLGLSTKTGIQISEATPKASDYNAVASAIGQGTNAYTSLNLARYLSTVANKGTCYNSSIVSKICDADGSNVTIIEPVADHTVEISDDIWTTVHNGMYRVINAGVLEDVVETLPVKVFGKSGTAQEDKTRGDHACYIMFSEDSYGNPDVAVSVMIPFGHSATHAGLMAYYAMSAYYDSELADSIIFTTKGKFEYNTLGE